MSVKKKAIDNLLKIWLEKVYKDGIPIDSRSVKQLKDLLNQNLVVFKHTRTISKDMKSCMKDISLFEKAEKEIALRTIASGIRKRKDIYNKEVDENSEGDTSNKYSVVFLKVGENNGN